MADWKAGAGEYAAAARTAAMARLGPVIGRDTERQVRSSRMCWHAARHGSGLWAMLHVTAAACPRCRRRRDAWLAGCGNTPGHSLRVGVAAAVWVVQALNGRSREQNGHRG